MSRNLTVQGDQFLLGGEPFRLVGGSIHYARVPRVCWRDRLEKLIDLGCNTLETYVFWNAHEAYPGDYRFDDRLDVVEWVKLAGSMGLHVIVRPGPYACAEWDMGGLPWWLLNEPGMALRCNNAPYLARVKKWWDVLLPKLAPLQSTRGGPIVAMQIENEYGYYGNDQSYLLALKSLAKENGIDVMTFTSDGTYSQLTINNGGLADGSLRTANFGSGAAERFRVLRKYQPAGPLVCMEYWVGWFDEWRTGKHSTRSAEETAKELDALLAQDAHAVIYMFHGGTNFGFTAGGNLSEHFQPYVTSYDYDALLSECGDVTPKFEACRDVIHKHLKLNREKQTFAPSKKTAYGKVKLKQSAPLDLALPKATRSATPLTMEQLGHGRGFAVYRTTLGPIYRGQPLVIRGMHDWCNVRVNGQSVATWYRRDPQPEIKLNFDTPQATLEIIVHNLARSNFGHRTNELKGITEGVYVGAPRHEERALFGWDCFALPLETLPASIPFSEASHVSGPGFFRGELTIAETPTDTFIELPSFDLGALFVNGQNVGRYWNVGPQQRLFVPASFLKTGSNNIVVFDAVGVKGEPFIECRDAPKLE
ncbi:MAG: beta-galactosidase [Tepidisphaeraceae bacterium]